VASQNPAWTENLLSGRDESPSSRRGARDIEHIGSAHDDVELGVLKAGRSPGACSPPESMERDAITAGLLASSGNKVEAAGAPGMSLGDHLPEDPRVRHRRPGWHLTRLRFGETRSER
jgi:hypothetical protein